MATDREFIVNKRFFIGLVIFVVIVVAIITFTIANKKTYYTCKQMKQANDTSYNAALDRDKDKKSCE